MSRITCVLAGALLTLGVAGLAAGAAAVASGDPDQSFGTGGLVTTDFLHFDSAAAVAVQADGKIVAAGGSWFPETTSIARYNPDGSLDPTFGTGGKATTAPSGPTTFALALQPDGKIVVGGYRVFRYTRAGVLDPTFGSGGVVTPSFIVRDIVVQTDAKLVLAGETGGFAPSNPQGAVVARFDPDGAPDTTFGSGGKVIADFGGFDIAQAVAIAPDGTITIAGETLTVSGGSLLDIDFAVARFLADGTPADAFGLDGVVTTGFEPSSSDHGDDLVLQPDGKVVVSGASRGQVALARYLPDGSLDPSFGVGGKATSVPGEAWGVALQPDGKLVAAVGGGGLAAMRFDPDGSPDATFGSGGRADGGFGGFSLDVALETDGDVIVAGRVLVGTGADSALVRYRGDGGVVPFASLSAAVAGTRRPGPADDGLQLIASFLPGKDSDGLDPGVEKVQIGIGDLSVSIPAGSFSARPPSWIWTGPGAGGSWHVQILRFPRNRYLLLARGSGLELTDLVSPAQVGITIGDDGGSTKVRPYVLGPA